MPADRLRQGLGGIEFVRIVSIGEPTPHPIAATRFLCVPCQVEVRKDGAASVEKFVLNIRAVHGQEDRWTIGGGF